MKKYKIYFNGEGAAVAYPHILANNQPVLETTDLMGHESSRCWVLYTKDYIVLQSYNTEVSIYDKGTKILTETKYSPTTSKQQSWFRHFLSMNGGFRYANSEIVY